MPRQHLTHDISIHALREEGDPDLRPVFFDIANFYPRPPRGGRQQRGVNVTTMCKISIHALREEGDIKERTRMKAFVISIHALREEGDSD